MLYIGSCENTGGEIVKTVKQLNDIYSSPDVRATGSHLPYGIAQCYLAPDTSEHTPPNPGQVGWYLINLPGRDRRLS